MTETPEKTPKDITKKDLDDWAKVNIPDVDRLDADDKDHPILDWMHRNLTAPLLIAVILGIGSLFSNMYIIPLLFPPKPAQAAPVTPSRGGFSWCTDRSDIFALAAN